MKYIGIKAARDNLHTLLKDINETREAITIERMGEPIATIIPSKDYDLILKVIALMQMTSMISSHEKKDGKKIRSLYGSLQAKKPINDWKKAEELAKEEYFANKKY